MAGTSRVGTPHLVAFPPGPAQGRGLGAGAGEGRSLSPPDVAEREREASPAQQGASSLESAYLVSVDRAILAAALLSGLIAIAVGLMVSRRIARPLARLADASRLVAEGRLDHRLEVVSHDELGRVASTFNMMAEKLQQIEEARRHLVADVAHDLRTPLAQEKGVKTDTLVSAMLEARRATLETRVKAGMLTPSLPIRPPVPTIPPQLLHKSPRDLHQTRNHAPYPERCNLEGGHGIGSEYRYQHGC